MATTRLPRERQFDYANEAHVVSTSIGHSPYTRHRHTIKDTPTTTHRALANDRPADINEPLFGCCEETDG